MNDITKRIYRAPSVRVLDGYEAALRAEDASHYQVIEVIAQYRDRFPQLCQSLLDEIQECSAADNRLPLVIQLKTEIENLKRQEQERQETLERKQ